MSNRGMNQPLSSAENTCPCDESLEKNADRKYQAKQNEGKGVKNHQPQQNKKQELVQVGNKHYW